MNPRFTVALSWFVTLLTPIVLILLGVRLVLVPAYPALAYRMPGFPDDPYGFSMEDRLKWSDYAIRYLLNDAGIEYLADLKFSDNSPLYNDRELGHMLEVKILVQEVIKVLYLLISILIGMGLWAYFKNWIYDYRMGLSRGGWLTVGLIIGVGLFAAISFWQFFTFFHEIFFSGDSWLFLYSDTLIRLFPIRFWQDVFMWVLGFALLAGAVLGWFLRPKAK
jgi:integral membrane protein (TIGR01906 family)